MFLIMNLSLLESKKGQSLSGGHPETGIKFVIKSHTDIPLERWSIHHPLTLFFKIFCFHTSVVLCCKTGIYHKNIQARQLKTTGNFVTFFSFL